MKNLLKKIALTLSLVVGIMSIPFPAFAADDEKIVKEDTIITDKFVDPNLVGTSNSKGIMPLNNYGESQVTTNYTTYKSGSYLFFHLSSLNFIRLLGLIITTM